MPTDGICQEASRSGPSPRIAFSDSACKNTIVGLVSRWEAVPWTVRDSVKSPKGIHLISIVLFCSCSYAACFSTIFAIVLETLLYWVHCFNNLGFVPTSAPRPLLGGCSTSMVPAREKHLFRNWRTGHTELYRQLTNTGMIESNTEIPRIGKVATQTRIKTIGIVNT